MAKGRFGWASSSDNPEKLSATIQGLAIGLIPMAIIGARFFGVELAETDLATLFEQIGIVASASITAFGLLRKIYFAFKQ